MTAALAPSMPCHGPCTPCLYDLALRHLRACRVCGAATSADTYCAEGRAIDEQLAAALAEGDR